METVLTLIDGGLLQLKHVKNPMTRKCSEIPEIWYL